MYILPSIWVFRTPNAGRNMLFQRFLGKNPENRKKKQEIWRKICQKNILILHYADWVLYFQKNHIFGGKNTFLQAPVIRK